MIQRSSSPCVLGPVWLTDAELTVTNLPTLLGPISYELTHQQHAIQLTPVSAPQQNPSDIVFHTPAGYRVDDAQQWSADPSTHTLRANAIPSALTPVPAR